MSYVPHILIVDDEPHICDSLRILLKRQGYEICTATSGGDALALLESRSFDLLLLDMVIPDMCGSEIMDHVNELGCDLLTIVITGNASIESAVTALRKGAYDYLKKPFEYEELVKRVGNALQQKRLVQEKKIINGKLERSEERYQYLVQNSPDIIYVLDERQQVLFANITMQRLLGYDPERLRGQPFFSLVHKQDQEKARKLFAHRQPDGCLTAIELRLQPRDHGAEPLLFAIDLSPIDLQTVHDNSHGRGLYGVARDITYRKKLEEQLLHANKMEAIGTLAGGIAHDFNNILMGIMGYTSLLLSQVPQESPHHDKLQSIEHHVRSGANLTRQLLGFARGGKYDVQPIIIARLLERTGRMFGRTKKEISMHCSADETLWAAEVDEGQIEQVLLNLYVNAWQAMPEGGAIYLSARNTPVDETMAQQLGLIAGRYVEVTVRDTGTGMSKDVRQKVFEPFFTTKSSDGGTGLGLASAYGIMKNHGGHITVQSREGEGACFHLYFPASDKQVQADMPANAVMMPGSETILLVDDEQGMLEVGAELLEELGYTVLKACCGRDAVDIYNEHRGGIDLVVVDLIMPEMNGGDLCAAIRDVDPAARLLLSSGYSTQSEEAASMLHLCNGFIQKPFAMRELSVKLREILDVPPDSAVRQGCA